MSGSLYLYSRPLAENKGVALAPFWRNAPGRCRGERNAGRGARRNEAISSACRGPPDSRESRETKIDFRRKQLVMQTSCKHCYSFLGPHIDRCAAAPASARPPNRSRAILLSLPC